MTGGSVRGTDTSGMLAYQCSESPMLGPAKIYFIIFGILTIAGGIIGYVKAGSMPRSSPDRSLEFCC